MAPKVIREDLVVPYVLVVTFKCFSILIHNKEEGNTNKIDRYKHSPAKPRSEASGMIAQSLPMAAMFMKNKLLSWTSLFLAIQSFLNEPIHKTGDKDSQQQPPLLKILFALIAVCTCYVDLIFPNSGKAAKAGNLAKSASETVSSVVSSATGSNV